MAQKRGEVRARQRARAAAARKSRRDARAAFKARSAARLRKANSSSRSSSSRSSASSSRQKAKELAKKQIQKPQSPKNPTPPKKVKPTNEQKLKKIEKATQQPAPTPAQKKPPAPVKQQPAPVKQPQQKIEDSFNEELNQGNPTQNVNTTTVGNNNNIYGGVGNTSNVTINSQGSGGGSMRPGINNMQSAAAYAALNNNAHNYSSSVLNGYGRAAGAVDSAEKTLGIRDRVANIYNMAGLTQDYWHNKAVSHQADYLGDIWKDGGFKFKMPGTYKNPEDKTQEIADGLDFKRKN